MPLRGRSAIITGANQGLGQTIAEEFVRAGASVFLVARGAERLAEVGRQLRDHANAPGQVVAWETGDVGDPDACRRVVASARAALPGLEILVNNAGVYGPMGRTEEVDWDEWAEAMRINCFGTALMCRGVLPHFRGAGYGKIINLSGGGATAPLPNISAYAASKAAVVRLTETLAEENKDRRVDVNAIAPGALNTRMLEQAIAAGPEKVGAAFHKKCLQQQQTGGTPTDKGASLAVFLASAQSDGISGRLLSAVWDDWAGLPGRREQLARSDVFTLRRITPDDRREQWHAA